MPVIPLTITSTMSVASELGGAFMTPAKCDDEGNLYIRKLAMDRPLLGPVVKIAADGKRTAIFDPSVFSQLHLDRADAFSAASDGGLYQVAQKGIVKPVLYVLHFFSDGTASTSVRLDADLEVYNFAAFANGSFLVSGLQRDVTNGKDPGKKFTAAFLDSGQMIAKLSFEPAPGDLAPGKEKHAGQPPTAASNLVKPAGPEKAEPILDLTDAEVGGDGNLYVMRRSSPVLIYVVSPSGTVLRTLKIATPAHVQFPSGFHLSANRLAVSFAHDENQSQTLVVADAQLGRRIAAYSFTDPTGAAPSFACYSANEGVFTFLRLGEGNALEVLRAAAE